MNFPRKEIVEAVRSRYPKGLRVELVSMDDPYSKLRPGAKGIVDHVDDTGTVFVNWACGTGLGMVYGVDIIRPLDRGLGMKDNKKGSLLMINDGNKAQYFSFPSVHGLADFAHYLFENRANAAGEPLPLWKRIPHREEITETAWSALADDLESADQYSCNMLLEIPLDLLWVNEDIGEGGSYYAFSFSAVMKAAASGTHGLWKRLLEQYPKARKGF